jgi:hypothetical protein
LLPKKEKIAMAMKEIIDEEGNIIAFEINCEICGEPISKTTPFGMMCENECQKTKAMKAIDEKLKRAKKRAK